MSERSDGFRSDPSLSTCMLSHVDLTLASTVDRWYAVQGFSCSWADHQTVENLALFPYSLSEDGAPVEPQGLPFASTATEGLEHLFGSSSFLASPPGTPAM